MKYNVNSLQHLGVGTSDLDKSWKFYKTFFGMDIPFFDAVAEAPLMEIYTRNEVINKRAAMILNLQGGCAMEVVQPYSFNSKKADFEIQLGDIGIFIGITKSKDVEAHYQLFKDKGAQYIVNEPFVDVLGRKSFFVTDPNGLYFQIVEENKFYTNLGHVSGSNGGAVLGVSDIDKSIAAYSELGYGKVLFDETRIFDEYKSLPGGNNKVRRVILTQNQPTGGGFAKAIGQTYIELVQVLDRTPKRMWTGRIWGDTGFVHLCFDVKGMKALGEAIGPKGFPFTCDSSNNLMMGKTRIHSTYIEDPDGILIELVEVYKLPIIEKWGIFMDVEKRDPMKPYPDLMLKALRFNRKK